MTDSKPSFVDRIKGVPDNIQEHWGSKFKDGAASETKRGLGGKLGIVAVSGVGLGVAYDGIRRMVTGPTNEAGEKQEQSWGRVAAGALEATAGLALVARAVTGKWAGGLHV